MRVYEKNYLSFISNSKLVNNLNKDSKLEFILQIKIIN